MLNTNITKLMKSMGISGRELAEYAGINPSIISRLRTGERIPDYSSTTISKIVNGIAIWCADNNMENELLYFLESQNTITRKNSLRTGILRYLYEDNLLIYSEKTSMRAIDKTSKGSTRYKYIKSNSFTFSEKLKRVMDLADLSNVQLSKLINVDPSYISRFKSGERIPSSGSVLLEPMCQAIFDKILSNNNTSKLAQLMNMSPDSKNNLDFLYVAFKEYLTIKDGNRESIFRFLKSIDSVLPISYNELPDYKSITDMSLLNDTHSLYSGRKGLRTAVERFLLNVIEKKVPEILIYSDEDMEWMTEDKLFYQKWIILMMEVMKQGTHIKIIHNIDRNIPEMMLGIESWLPIYMAGSIQPYYLDSKVGNRFSHTLIAAPGECTIASCIIKGTEDNGDYYYSEEKSTIDQVERNFMALLSTGNPLVRVVYGEQEDINTKIIENVETDFVNRNNKAVNADSDKNSNKEFRNIRISVNKDSVYISKLNNPVFTFVFYHPLMCEAMKIYLKNLKLAE